MVLKPRVIRKTRKLRFEDGLSIRLIAVKLHISPTTVAKYIKNMKDEESVASEKTRLVTYREKNRPDDEPVDEYEMLDRIISEVTRDPKRPGIVRMVAPFLPYPWKSLTVLAKALTMAEINPHERELILRNWGAHVGIKDEDVKKIL